jgi:hypothetical protein
MENLFRSEQERKVTLTKTEQENILKTDPSFSLIKKAVYFDNYDLPCPIRVEIETVDGQNQTVVLRKNRHGDIKNETRIFRALKEFGIPVPEILVEPFETDRSEYAAVYSLLPGENLQKLSMRGDKYLIQARDLLIEAVAELSNITTALRNHSVAEIIPDKPLLSELKSTYINNPWAEEGVFQSAARILEVKFKDIQVPLMLSNGDYQPGNFLALDGKLTGFLDFESASFQDPLMGFVKYPIYDMIPLSRTDLVNRFLSATGFSKKDFDIRLALGCLKTLRKEIPVTGGDAETVEYRNRVLSVLSNSLDI